MNHAITLWDIFYIALAAGGIWALGAILLAIFGDAFTH